MSNPVTEIRVLVWYATEADYIAARAVNEDGPNWHGTYAAWRAFAEKREVRLWAKGVATCRVALDPSVFVHWCRALQRKVCHESRVQYAAFVFEEANGARGGDVLKFHDLSKPDE